jgi:Aminotransferase class-V/NifU-like N terminal domain
VHEVALTREALGRLAEVPGLTVLGPPSATGRAGVISFTIQGAHPHDVAEVLNRTNVCVRAGHHCAQPLMRHLGLAATTRVSFGPYNATDDLDALMVGLHDVAALLQQRGSLRTHSELAGHCRRPRNFGDLAHPDLDGQASVELCGDDLGVHPHVTGGRITAIRFHGHGCALAISAASYTSDQYVGLPLIDLPSVTTDWALDLLPITVPAIPPALRGFAPSRCAVRARGLPPGVSHQRVSRSHVQAIPDACMQRYRLGQEENA